MELPRYLSLLATRVTDYTYQNYEGFNDTSGCNTTSTADPCILMSSSSSRDSSRGGFIALATVMTFLLVLILCSYMRHLYRYTNVFQDNNYQQSAPHQANLLPFFGNRPPVPAKAEIVSTTHPEAVAVYATPV
jgi:hypothetical protein